MVLSIASTSANPSLYLVYMLLSSSAALVMKARRLEKEHSSSLLEGNVGGRQVACLGCDVSHVIVLALTPSYSLFSCSGFLTKNKRFDPSSLWHKQAFHSPGIQYGRRVRRLYGIHWFRFASKPF